jgi:hypothetical protein
MIAAISNKKGKQISKQDSNSYTSFCRGVKLLGGTLDWIVHCKAAAKARQNHNSKQNSKIVKNTNKILAIIIIITRSLFN